MGGANAYATPAPCTFVGALHLSFDGSIIHFVRMKHIANPAYLDTAHTASAMLHMDLNPRFAAIETKRRPVSTHRSLVLLQIPDAKICVLLIPIGIMLSIVAFGRNIVVGAISRIDARVNLAK